MSAPAVNLRMRWPILIALGAVGVTFALLISKKSSTPGADTTVHKGEPSSRSSAFVGPAATPSASMTTSPHSIPLSWVGRYSFTESCGRNVAGTGVAVEHVLTVRADGSGELDADGYQTMLRLPTTMVGSPDRLEVRLGGEGATEMFGRDVLPGELLLVLRRASGSIVTDWNDYSSMCTAARTGKTFQRVTK